MAFTAVVTRRGITADGRREYEGTYVNDGGSTGGDILTTLNRCDVMILQAIDTTVEANAPVINETFPVVGGAITIVCDANESGVWIARGV